jgi:perosamine synthetase
MTNTLTAQKTEPGQIPITKPVFGSEEKEAIGRVLDSGWIVQGPNVALFEKLFAEFVGCQHAIATTSCTTALHLALLAAGIGPGDEVLIPSFTFIATANAVEYAGARPVLIDINLETFNIDPEKLRNYLKSNRHGRAGCPRAVIPVSLFGLCAQMDQINEIAQQYGLVVIEDAACGFGGYRQGHHAGTEALAACFSFHPRKAITTGEGGMIITDDDQLAATARKLRDHGASKTDLERHLQQGGSLLPDYDLLGYNYRMTDIQGALGVAQMSKAQRILDGRQQAAQRYHELLRSAPQLRAPVAPHDYVHGYQSYVCLFQPMGPWSPDADFGNWQRIEKANQMRNRLMAFLESQKISVRQGTHAVHTLGYYRTKYDLSDQDLPCSFLADRLSITLPLYSGITRLEQVRVVDTISDFLDKL